MTNPPSDIPAAARVTVNGTREVDADADELCAYFGVSATGDSSRAGEHPDYLFEVEKRTPRSRGGLLPC